MKQWLISSMFIFAVLVIVVITGRMNVSLHISGDKRLIRMKVSGVALSYMRSCAF